MIKQILEILHDYAIFDLETDFTKSKELKDEKHPFLELLHYYGIVELSTSFTKSKEWKDKKYPYFFQFSEKFNDLLNENEVAIIELASQYIEYSDEEFVCLYKPYIFTGIHERRLTQTQEDIEDYKVRAGFLKWLQTQI